MPRVSVLMPAYNAARYIEAAVESVLAQNYSDFEFIIVDDGSTDATPEILARYTAQDRRIRLIRNDENLGLIRSLNVGLNASSSEFIARMDADDLSSIDRLRSQVDFLDAHPCHILVGSSYRAIDENGHTLWTKITDFDDTQVRWIARFRTPFGHSGVMFRRLGPDSAPWRYSVAFEAREDYDLWLRMLEKGRAAVLVEPLFSYRIHARTITGTMEGAMARNGLVLALRNARATLPANLLEGLSIFLRAYHNDKGIGCGDARKIVASFDAMLAADITAFPQHKRWFRKQAAGVLAEGLLAKGRATRNPVALGRFLLSARAYLPWLAVRVFEDKGASAALWKRRAPQASKSRSEIGRLADGDLRAG